MSGLKKMLLLLHVVFNHVLHVTMNRYLIVHFLFILLHLDLNAYHFLLLAFIVPGVGEQV